MSQTIAAEARGAPLPQTQPYQPEPRAAQPIRGPQAAAAGRSVDWRPAGRTNVAALAQAPLADPTVQSLQAQIKSGEFTVVAHNLRELADRLDASERRSQAAIEQVSHSLNAIAEKADAADRIKDLAETAFSSAAEVINQSARDQAQAFDALETTVRGLGERLDTVEQREAADPVARETVSHLETALDGLKTRLADAEKKGSEAQSSLENWVKGLTKSLAPAEAVDSLSKDIKDVRKDLAQTEQRQKEKAEALAVIQNGLTAIRTEITETDRRARDAAVGLENWIKDLAARFEATESVWQTRLGEVTKGFVQADQLREVSKAVDGVRGDWKKAAEALKTELKSETAARALDHDRAARESQSALESWIRRISERLEQSSEGQAASNRTIETNVQRLSARLDSMDAQGSQTLTETRDALAQIDARLRDVAASNDPSQHAPAIEALQDTVEHLQIALQSAEHNSAASAKTTAQAIRRVEEMIQGFARSLDTVGDVAGGPLSAPMGAVKATLETITAKIEETDKRAANSIGTIEAALKALSARIEESDKRQGDRSGGVEETLKSYGARLEQSERRTTDAIGVIESGMSTISQRLDTAERRHKEAIAGLRMTVDGLVSRASQDTATPAPAARTYSFAPQTLSAAPVNELPPAPQRDLTPPPFEAPPALPPVASVPPVSAPGMTTSTVARLLSETQAPPPPAFEDLVARSADGVEPFHEEVPAAPPPRKADDFLAQARRAAQAAAKAEAEAAPPKKGFLGAKTDHYSIDGARSNIGRLVIVGLAFVGLVAGVIAIVVTMPRNQESDDPNRPAPSASIGEILGANGETTTPPNTNAAKPFAQLPAPAAQPAPAAAHPAPAESAPALTAPSSLPAEALPPAPAFEPAPATGPASAPAPTAATADPEVASLQTAADKGEAKAQYLLGMRFTEGRGVAQDRAKAAALIERAAAQNYVPAQYRLGAFHEQGFGVPKDMRTARSWYEKAAIAGNRKAMHNLAVLYAEGSGPAAMKDAAKWFSEAAAYGLTDSQYNLGVLFERGLGVEQNLTEAAKWFAIAAAQGDPEAPGKLDEVRKRLNGPDVAFALEGARNFKPKALNAEANEAAAR